jgi:hypothetical protein
MSTRSTFAKGALAATAGLMALTSAAAVPTFASAQSYGGGYYDPCSRAQTNRGTVGALLGGALGAAVGSNVAAGKNRTEGALLGGALGAVTGGVVGNRSAACGPQYNSYSAPPPAPAYQQGYYNNGYNSGYNNGYDRYGANADYGYAYGDSGQRYRIAERPGSDGCSLAESPIYLPDGGVQKRFVRVCRDSSGRYQVVD